MAIARVLERDDLGGITFARDDGSTLYSYGPDAEALASELEQSAPAPPPQEYALDRSRLDDVLADAPRLAQAGGGGFIEAAQAQRASDAQAARARAVQAPGGIAGELADLQAQGYGAGPEPAPAPPPADPFLDAINAPVYVPGSPGVSRAQLEQRAGQAVPIPKGYTEQVEGAVPLPPELMAEQGRIFDERAELARHEALGTMAGGEAQASRALADNQYWQRQAILRRAELHEARQKAEAKWSQIQQADQAIAAHQDDPQRFFKEKGTFATIAAAIAMGIGQYSASLGGGQNAAAAIISDAIDRDIAAQRQEYLTKKDARNNLVAQYDKILGDLDAATQAAAYTQKGIAISYGNQLAGLSKSAQAESAWAKELLKLDQERLDVATKWIEKQTGKVVATTQSAVEFPRAASGGYKRAPTDKERRGRAENLAGTQKAYREYYGIPDPQKVGEIEAAGRAKAAPKQAADVRAAAEKYGKELGTNIVGADASLRRVEELLKSYEGKDIPASGLTGGLYDYTGPGRRALTLLQSAEGQKLHNALIDLEEKRILMLTGAAAPEQQMARIKQAVRGLTDEQLRANIQRVRLEIEEQRRNARATYGPEAVDLYESRKGSAVQRERSDANADTKDKGLR